jgi:predicted amidophosphoribosyltransferase
MKIDYHKDYYSFRTLNNYCDEAYICPNCKGLSIRIGYKYCPDCGKDLQWTNLPYKT